MIKNAKPSWQIFPSLSLTHYRLQSWTNMINSPRRVKTNTLELKRSYIGSRSSCLRSQGTGPLTCLPVVRADGNPSKEQMVQLLQRALVQVGSASQAINTERRKIGSTLAWKTWQKSHTTIERVTFLGQRDDILPIPGSRLVPPP